MHTHTLAGSFHMEALDYIIVQSWSSYADAYTDINRPHLHTWCICFNLAVCLLEMLKGHELAFSHPLPACMCVWFIGLHVSAHLSPYVWHSVCAKTMTNHNSRESRWCFGRQRKTDREMGHIGKFLFSHTQAAYSESFPTFPLPASDNSPHIICVSYLKHKCVKCLYGDCW